jgi:hypothetical protein
MGGRYIEPRRVMWAMAEITWEDADGTSFRVPATLEDTSMSGACVRTQRPLAVGSRITVRWHREQFSAVTRNCRSEGRDFLLGVRRDAGTPSSIAARHGIAGQAVAAPAKTKVESAGPESTSAARNPSQAPKPEADSPGAAIEKTRRVPSADRREEVSANASRASAPAPRMQTEIHTPGALARPERKVMQPKTIFPHFWRRKQDHDAPANPTITEAPVNKANTQEPTPSGPRGELLRYDDIYRAAGIMSSGSGYGMHKVVEMLNNERIRDLTSDAKRASVLMALDAAGVVADELLTDATRRQNALNSYETAQSKQLDEFEVRKSKENARIEEELEKIRVHYAQRVQANLDQVAKEKEALRSWQMAMQHETQRIAEVLELCGKQPAEARNANALAAAAGAQGVTKPQSASADAGRPAPPRPTLLGGS